MNGARDEWLKREDSERKTGEWRMPSKREMSREELLGEWLGEEREPSVLADLRPMKTDMEALVGEALASVGQEEMLLVPGQTRLDGNRRIGNSLHDSSSDAEDSGYVLQHTCACTLAGNLLDRTAEVDVEHIGMRLLHNDSCRLAHSIHIFTIYLNGDGTFFGTDLQLK